MIDHIIVIDQLFAMGIMYGEKDFTTFTMLGDAQLPGQVFDFVIDRFERTEDDYICSSEGSEEEECPNRSENIGLR